MIEIKQFAEEISTLFNKQFDFAFNQLLQSSIIGYRATILKQEFDKNGRFPRGSEESLCLEITSVSATECCVSEDLECEVRRTKYKVPKPIRTNLFSDPFLFVGTSNMERAFTYQRAENVKLVLESSKFLKDRVFYDYFNDYIYVFNYEGGKVGIRDVFSNPMELLELKDCDGNPCKTDVYIDDDMKRMIKQMVLEEFRVIRQVPDEQQIRLNEQSTN
jgi:hypothetical protein